MLLTVPIWVVLNLVLAPFRVCKEEREKGKWHGRRFVYHSPHQVFTTLVGPSDHGKYINFMVEDAEPNTFVQFKIVYDGGLAKVRIQSPMDRLPANWEGIGRNTQYGAKIDKNRMAGFDVHCPENSDSTIVRIQMLSWEV